MEAECFPGKEESHSPRDDGYEKIAGSIETPYPGKSLSISPLALEFFPSFSACPFGQLPPLPLRTVNSSYITTDSFMDPPPLLLTMKPADGVSAWLVVDETCWILLPFGRLCLARTGHVLLPIRCVCCHAAQRFRRLGSGARDAPQSRARL